MAVALKIDYDAGMNKPWSIYGLVDPRDGRVRYVGFTTESIQKRLYRHINNAATRPLNLPVYDWISFLKGVGMVPDVLLLQEGIGRAECEVAERYWIASYRAKHPDMLNRADGGIAEIPAEARKRAAEKHRGIPRPATVREKVSQGVKANWRIHKRRTSERLLFE